MLPQQYCLRWKYHHSNLQTMFSQLLDRGCFCDVTLACEGQLIRAHRVVLCACSTFFDTVLTNYASERDPIIIMKDVTFADVKCLIEFMYKGEINVEHANLTSLLKTADDLKIKGLAEVSWREDEDTSPPPPTPATEFNSPTRTHDAYAAVHDFQQQKQHQSQEQHQYPQYTQHNHRTLTPPPLERVRGRSTSPAVLGVVGKQAHLPILTAIPSSTNSISIATSPPTAVDHYLGPKRKRGRPPLDDAYDIFNARKLAAHYPGPIDAQSYLESLHYAGGGVTSEEQQRGAAHPSAPPHSPTLSSAAAAAAMAAYHQHMQQQQQQHQQQQQSLKQRQRHKHRHHSPIETSPEQHDSPADAEWISSNFEVKNSEEARTASAENVSPNNADNEVKKIDYKIEAEEQALSLRKLEKLGGKKRERSPGAAHREKPLKVRLSRKSSAEKSDNEQKTDTDVEVEAEEESDQQQTEHLGSPVEHTVPQPVEEMEIESKQQQQQQQAQATEYQATVNRVSKSATPPVATLNGSPPHTTASPSSASPTAASSTTARSSPTIAENAIPAHKNNNSSMTHAQPPPPPPLHHPHFGKYAPEGYLLNEHGMLVAHDFVHAPTASIPTASSGTATTNGSEQDYGDGKMEDYDAADLRLTTEEMREWQDVIKMDDYLAKGRRPQFWEEPFTRRVLDAIKNKRLEMKKAARILGVSYGTLYGRYREVYGCLKHPNNTFRPPQTSQLTVVPSRFDAMVWPAPKRDSGLLTAPLEIGKIRPKDMSELWARPQI